MFEAEEIALLLKAALPIDDVDQFIAPGLSFAIIWIDIAERPDLALLARQEEMADGYSICTWFYENPGHYNMRMGLRVEMREPVHCVIILVFPVRKYVKQLMTMSREGNLWIIPGPPPAHLKGLMQLSPKTFLDQVVAYAGQGLFLTLEEHMVEELRTRLAEWKRQST